MKITIGYFCLIQTAFAGRTIPLDYPPFRGCCHPAGLAELLTMAVRNRNNVSFIGNKRKTW